MKSVLQRSEPPPRCPNTGFLLLRVPEPNKDPKPRSFIGINTTNMYKTQEKCLSTVEINQLLGRLYRVYI